MLSDGGILEAVEDRCARLPLEVTVETSEGLRERRFGDDIEGAAYFFVTEALANVLKHAGATRAVVSLTYDDGRLLLGVADDGRGFEPETASDNGLTGLRDRIHALGGTVSIASRPGRWNACFGVTSRGWVVNIVIADDHYLVREGTRRSSSQRRGRGAGRRREHRIAARRCGEASSGRGHHRHPDAPNESDEGIEAAHAIRSRHPDVGIVVLSQYANSLYAFELFREGTAGLAYLLKDRVGDLDELLRALREVATGGSVIDPMVVEGLLARGRASRVRFARHSAPVSWMS